MAVSDSVQRRKRTVVAGAPAPDFELEGTTGEGGRRTYTLRELRGSPVVLAFYPADSTPVCTMQLRSYTEEFPRFAELDAQVLAISPQGLDEHEAFAAAEGGFAFPLLSDPDKEVAAAYETLGPLGFYRRAVVIIDREGIVRWTHRAVGTTFRSVEELAGHLAGL